jgi:N-acetylglucosaminyldiphosphoundecaprenol N-acetyl-beta-D-mannosaminyltransferase
VKLVLDRARSGDGAVIGNLNLHGAYVFHTDAEFRAYCESSDVILVDGAPIAWLGRIPTRLRVGSTDWLDAFMPVADGLSVLAVGGTKRAALATQHHMNEQFPRVRWRGIDGYRSRAVGPELRRQIEDADVVLVGMGMPLQERWILRNKDLLAGKVVANVGGCFDYYAGIQHLAPRWMGRMGLEWLYRLARDPRRLGHRYLVEPFKLIGVLIAQRYRSRKRAVAS